jgi:hypothetical protein
MAKMRQSEKHGGKLFLSAAIVVLVFSLYSLAIAWSTINDCDGYAGKSWQVFPPEWECTGTRGFG